ncbi:MAG: hypothetical protein RPU37_03005, partial [Candidatus Sedimenticola sp. (ex Thyasira tokunagai)]
QNQLAYATAVMPRPSCVRHDSVLHIAAKLLVHYSIMTPAMTLRRFGCTPCMPYIAPCRSQFRPYNRAYAYRGLIASAFSLPWLISG